MIPSINFYTFEMNYTYAYRALNINEKETGKITEFQPEWC